MNFFQQQDEARKSTRYLVLLFCLAVFLLVVLTNVVVMALLWGLDTGVVGQQQAYVEAMDTFQYQDPWSIQHLLSYFQWQRLLLVSASVVGVVGGVILFKRMALLGGGKVVAESLGGKKISLNTKISEERQVLNVVEEMAIASGVPVPPVYILEEACINAFAAGYNSSDAVIGVSRGCINTLNRDQLQGVVAHEFSHILNGDMRLNINLIAVLAGILFIGHAGWMLVRMNSGYGYHRSRSRDKNGGSLIVAGFAFVVIGFVGTFFGKLIKAAVSRQREFLADASAVQFTRNPSGIADALKAIGGYSYGSRLDAPKTEEMSHLFFSDSLSKNLNTKVSSWFSTHPPLAERIKAIEPRWDGKYIEAKADAGDHSPEVQSNFASGAGYSGFSSSDQNASQLKEGSSDVENAVDEALIDLDARVDKAGSVNPEQYRQAQQLVFSIGEELREALSLTEKAKSLVYLLLLSKQSSVRNEQIAYLKNNESDAQLSALREVNDELISGFQEHRIDLVELAIPALKELSHEGYNDFISCIAYLVKADGEIDLFEWLLHSLIVHHLKPNYGKVNTQSPKYKNLSKLRNECRFLLSYIVAHGDPSQAHSFEQFFDRAFNSLDLGESTLLPFKDVSLKDVNNAVFHFSRLYPLVKPKLLKACALAIQADGVVTLEEYELLRVIAALIDCPMPLLERG